MQMMTLNPSPMSKPEKIIDRQGTEVYVQFTLKNTITGEIAQHLLYDNRNDAVSTARYWHAAGWVVVPVTVREVRQ